MSIQDKFQAAVNVIKGLPKDGPYQPSNEMALKFYGLYKQATEGPCLVPKPPFYQVVGGYKWQAWKAVGSISKEEAMDKYVTELKKIVETMSYSADVATFMEALGPFYEYVDVPGNNNDPKCIKGQAEPDDTSQEGDDIAEDSPVEVTSKEDPPTSGFGEQQEANSERESVGSKAVVHSGISSVLEDHNGGVPFRNGHLSSHMGNGVVSKAFFMASPVPAAEQDLASQHRLHQQQQQQFQQEEVSGARTAGASDTDSDEEYSEPSESLAFCSGSSGVPAASLTKANASEQSPERLPGVEEKIHVDGLQYLSSATNCSLVYGDTTDQYLYSNGTAYSVLQTHGRDGERFDPITTNGPHSGSSAAAVGHLQESFPAGGAGSGHVALPAVGLQHHIASTSTGQPVALVCSQEMVQAMHQMQLELSSLTRCLDAHLSDISRGLAALREPIAALQNPNSSELSARGSDALRRRRRWWPLVPELSRRSAVWLLLWPVFVHLAIKLLGAVIAIRRRRNK